MRNKKQLSKLLSYMSTFDGGIYEPYKKNPNSKVNCQFIMNMRKENLDYIKWVGEVLGDITGYRITDRKDYNTDGCKRKEQVRLESNRHPYFTKLRERIYINNHKVIDPHMLKLMDAEALAIIFMTDGSSSLETRFKNLHCKITLETNGFSYADNLSLSKAIYNSTRIRTTVQKKGKYFLLYVKTADKQLFVDTIKPYMLESFMYKLGRIAPALQGGDIVCTNTEVLEIDGDDQSPS